MDHFKYRFWKKLTNIAQVNLIVDVWYAAPDQLCKEMCNRFYMRGISQYKDVQIVGQSRKKNQMVKSIMLVLCSATQYRFEVFFMVVVVIDGRARLRRHFGCMPGMPCTLSWSSDILRRHELSFAKRRNLAGICGKVVRCSLAYLHSASTPATSTAYMCRLMPDSR